MMDMDTDTESGGSPGFFNGEEAEIAGSEEQGSSSGWDGCKQSLRARKPQIHSNAC